MSAASGHLYSPAWAATGSGPASCVGGGREANQENVDVNSRDVGERSHDSLNKSQHEFVLAKVLKHEKPLEQLEEPAAAAGLVVWCHAVIAAEDTTTTVENSTANLRGKTAPPLPPRHRAAKLAKGAERARKDEGGVLSRRPPTTRSVATSKRRNGMIAWSVVAAATTVMLASLLVTATVCQDWETIHSCCSSTPFALLPGLTRGRSFSQSALQEVPDDRLLHETLALDDGGEWVKTTTAPDTPLLLDGGDGCVGKEEDEVVEESGTVEEEEEGEDAELAGLVTEVGESRSPSSAPPEHEEEEKEQAIGTPTQQQATQRGQSVEARTEVKEANDEQKGRQSLFDHEPGHHEEGEGGDEGGEGGGDGVWAGSCATLEAPSSSSTTSSSASTSPSASSPERFGLVRVVCEVDHNDDDGTHILREPHDQHHHRDFVSSATATPTGKAATTTAAPPLTTGASTVPVAAGVGAVVTAGPRIPRNPAQPSPPSPPPTLTKSDMSSPNSKGQGGEAFGFLVAALLLPLLVLGVVGRVRFLVGFMVRVCSEAMFKGERSKARATERVAWWSSSHEGQEHEEGPEHEREETEEDGALDEAGAYVLMNAVGSPTMTAVIAAAAAAEAGAGVSARRGVHDSHPQQHHRLPSLSVSLQGNKDCDPIMRSAPPPPRRRAPCRPLAAAPFGASGGELGESFRPPAVDTSSYFVNNDKLQTSKQKQRHDEPSKRRPRRRWHKRPAAHDRDEEFVPTWSSDDEEEDEEGRHEHDDHGSSRHESRESRESRSSGSGHGGAAGSRFWDALWATSPAHTRQRWHPNNNSSSSRSSSKDNEKSNAPPLPQPLAPLVPPARPSPATFWQQYIPDFSNVKYRLLLGEEENQVDEDGSALADPAADGTRPLPRMTPPRAGPLNGSRFQDPIHDCSIPSSKKRGLDDASANPQSAKKNIKEVRA